MSLSTFQNIRAVAADMAYCNGAVNRYSTEELVLRPVDAVLAAADSEVLVAIDSWIGTLSEDERSVLADGEDGEMRALLARSPNPDATDCLLHDIFSAL